MAQGKQTRKYVHDASFRRPNMASRLFGGWDRRLVKQRLIGESERLAFLRYNYARYRGANRVALALRSWIVECNIGLCHYIAQRYQQHCTGVDYGDLLSEAFSGLLNAVDHFACDKGFRFSTYASRSIWLAMSRATTRRARRQREQTGWQFASMPAATPDADHETAEISAAVQGMIQTNAANLSTKELRTLELRFGDQSLTLEEAGKILHCTRESIRQTQLTALKKLRRACMARGLSL